MPVGRGGVVSCAVISEPGRPRDRQPGMAGGLPPSWSSRTLAEWRRYRAGDGGGRGQGDSPVRSRFARL